MNNSLSNKLLSYVPAYVTEAVGAFEALSLEFEEAVDDYDSRTSFLHFIADNWSLEAISSISNETIAALLDLFRSGDFNPTPFAVGIDDNLLKAEKLFERTLSQTTSVADDLTIKSPSPLPLRPQTPTDALPVPAASLDILVKVDRKNVKTITASEAISNIAYQLSDFAFIYPVVASEYPGESMLTWSEEGKVNQEGAVTKVINITTQPGAGQTVMGTLLGGSKANVIMSSAALGHLVPSMFGFQRRNVYPVFHVAAHSIDQDLVIHFDHSDVYKVAHTGFTILASSSHQEAQDLALIAHLLAKVSTTPVLHFFDGSLLAAQKSAIYVLEESQVSHALQLTETLIAEPFNGFTEISKKVESVLGRTIKPLEYVGCPRATTVFISMGHSSDLISKAVHDLVGNGAAVGCVIIRMYRPWSVEHFVDLIPAATTKIVVIDQAERISPLAVDVEASFYGKANEPSIMTRKFKEGLENIHPAAVKEFILSASSGLVPELIELSPRSEIHDSNVVQAIFWDQKDAGTLNALPLLAKDHIKVGPYFQQSFVQNLSTDYEPSQVAHLRFSQNHIDVHHLIDQADVVMCNSLGAAKSYNFAASIRRNGILFINSELSGEELWNSLDSNVQQTLVEKNVVVYHLDATLVSENYTIFYGKAKDYIIEILVAVFYHLAYPYEVAKKFLSAQSQRITSSSSSRNVEKSLKEAILFALNHLKTLPTGIPKGDNHHLPAFVKGTVPSKSQFVATEPASENVLRAVSKHEALLPVIFPSYKVSEKFRPDLENVYTVTVTENTRLTPDSYERNVFHMELDITGSGLKYDIGNALGVYAKNDSHKVTQFLSQHGLDPKQTIFIDRHDEEGNCFSELRSLEQLFIHNLDVFGKPGKKFYQYLATKATSDEEKEIIAALLESSETLDEFVEQYTPTFADLLVKFPSAKFSVEELIRTIPAIKPRLYSISSSQRAHPNSVHLLIVLVDWIDKHGVTRFGQATNFLVNSKIGDLLTVTLKPSVMKLPPSLETPVIMSGLGTGMAPFRAFIEERMYWKRKGKKVGPMALYFGSRNRANEYLYGEELEAYHSEGILNHLRLAFSRDQAEKVYIQHKIQEDRDHLHDLIVKNKGSFYLCGPTWPVPDITEALLTAFESSMTGEEALSFIEDLKEEDRFVLEVY